MIGVQIMIGIVRVLIIILVIIIAKVVIIRPIFHILIEETILILKIPMIPVILLGAVIRMV